MLRDVDRITELCVEDGVGEPSLPEALPPHGHLVHPSVGRGDDADEVVVGDVEHALCLIDSEFETFPLELGIVIPPEGCGGEVGDGVPGVCFARAGGELGVGGLYNMVCVVL